MHHSYDIETLLPSSCCVKTLSFKQMSTKGEPLPLFTWGSLTASSHSALPESAKDPCSKSQLIL